MKVLNIYTYKGSKTSLVAPWCAVSYLIDTDIYYYEDLVPHTKHIFDKRSNLERFSDLKRVGSFDLITIEAEDINNDGSYAVKNSQELLARRAMWSDTKFHVNIISKPTTWYERWTVIQAVFYRNEYLKRRSRPNCNLLELESDLNAHVNLLATYKHLPPMYIWDKTMEAIKNVEPKPRWWFSEINHLWSLFEYDEPC